MGAVSNALRNVLCNSICKGVRYAVCVPSLVLTCSAGFAADYSSYPVVQVPYTVAPPAGQMRYDAKVAPPVGNDGTGAVSSVPAPKPLDGLGFGAGVALSFGQ